MRWVVPNSEVEVLFVDERPAGVQVPSAVEMAVTETQPGVKGDTASGGGTKPATLESGRAGGRAAVRQRGRPGAGRHPKRRVRLARVGRPRPVAMRRSDQRRAAVFALYQERGDRPPGRRGARRRGAVHARAGRGGGGAPRRARRRDRPARARLGARPDRGAREEHHARGPVSSFATATTCRPRWRSTRRSRSPSATAAPTPRDS